MPAHNVLPTDNGKVFNIALDAGSCFAMSLDVAKVLLEFGQQGKPTKVPTASDLTPGKWAIVQSAYEINSQSNDQKLIVAQGLAVTRSTSPTRFNGDFDQVGGAITGLRGTTVFGITGTGGGHELMWHRDDSNTMWLYLEPNDGLWQFASVKEARDYITADLAGYHDLDETFDSFTLDLA